MDPERAVSTTIPARLDALPWSRWHWRVVLALGVTWLLDGLEVTVVGSLGAALQRPEVLGLSVREVGLSGSAYIAGAVPGALVFGRLADRWGRKRLFLITLAVYLAGTVATAFAWDFASFAALRFVTGFGIGGEYAAINSAIDELIPARVRGAVDLAINGTFWIGAALGAALSLVLLDPRFFPPALGWRLAFGLGAVLGLAMLLVRRHVPESPRWLVVQGRLAQAEAELTRIETEVAAQHGALPTAFEALSVTLRPPPSWREIGRLLTSRYRRRALLGTSLMASQAFFYNAIFFTYALVLAHFYGVPDREVGLYVFPFALGNFLGPLLLGPLFDRIGRRVMISSTYLVAGVGLFLAGALFRAGWLDATTQALCWAAIFFVASAAASSAYLTVSEIFPLEIRAISISIFYALGTGIGGFLGPALFAELIEIGSRDALFAGYALAAAVMCGAGLAAAWLGVDAERKPLEEIAPPLSAN
jgi:MFS family permease